MKKTIAILLLVVMLASMLMPIAFAGTRAMKTCAGCGQRVSAFVKCPGNHSRRGSAGSHVSNTGAVCNYYTLQLNMEWVCPNSTCNHQNQTADYHDHVIIHECQLGAVDVCQY